MCPIEPPSIAADSPFSITALSRNHSNIFIISPVYSSSWCPHKLLHWKMPLSKWWLGIWEMKNNIQQCIPWYVPSLGNKQTFHLGGKNIIDDICGWLSPMYPHHVEKLTWWFNIHMKNQHVSTHHMSSGLKIEGFEAWNSEKVLVQSSIFIPQGFSHEKSNISNGFPSVVSIGAPIVPRYLHGSMTEFPPPGGQRHCPCGRAWPGWRETQCPGAAERAERKGRRIGAVNGGTWMVNGDIVVL